VAAAYGGDATVWQFGERVFIEAARTLLRADVERCSETPLQSTAGRPFADDRHDLIHGRPSILIVNRLAVGADRFPHAGKQELAARRLDGERKAHRGRTLSG